MNIRICMASLVLLCPALARAQLDSVAADRFARLALSCIDREFPNKPEHVLDSSADAKPPRLFHPIFFGCYDWHSSAHGHWLLARLLGRFPEMSAAAEVRARLASHFTPGAVAAEVTYLDRISAKSFERPYGWAWALRLVSELDAARDPERQRWRAALALLERAIVSRLKDYLPKLTHPIRTGVHPNTAFALAEAHDYARRTGDAELVKLLEKRSREYFAADRACPLSFEPSGEDFFSPCLEEADLMRRVLPAREFEAWLAEFLPGLAAGRLFPLAPVTAADPTDPKLVHLDGLNLTRAWTLLGIAQALPASDARREILERSSRAHARAGLARVSSGHYEGEHWLASFAVYLETRAGLQEP